MLLEDMLLEDMLLEDMLLELLDGAIIVKQ